MAGCAAFSFGAPGRRALQGDANLFERQNFHKSRNSYFPLLTTRFRSVFSRRRCPSLEPGSLWSDALPPALARPTGRRKLF